MLPFRDGAGRELSATWIELRRKGMRRLNEGRVVSRFKCVLDEAQGIDKLFQ